MLSDAAYIVLSSDAKTTTGNFFIGDVPLREHGVTDLEKYRVTPGKTDLIPDFVAD